MGVRSRVHWFPNSCRASVVFIATLKRPSPLLSPLFLPLHCPPALLSGFGLLLSGSPPPPLLPSPKPTPTHRIPPQMLNSLTYWPLTPPPGLQLSSASSFCSPSLTPVHSFSLRDRRESKRSPSHPHVPFPVRPGVALSFSPSHLLGFCSKLH